jgi:uncharacterized protein (TIRG00374 family)
MVDKNKLFFGLRFAISFGLLFLLIWLMRNDIGDISKILKNSNKFFLIAALAINIPLTILLSYRLKLLMEGQAIYLSIKDVIYLTFIGFFFNNFLPTAIGGDIAKAHYASKKTNNTLASYAAVASDRLFGLAATVSIATMSLLFMGRTLKNNAIAYAVFGTFAALALVALFLLNKSSSKQPLVDNPSVMGKIKEKIYKLYAAVNLYRNNRLLLIKAFLLSVFLQAISIVGLYLFVLCLGGQIALVKLFLIIPLVWTISMLPSLNGLGVREGAFVYFLKGDIGADTSLAVSLLWLGVIIFYSVVGGVMYLLYPVKAKTGMKIT